MLSLKFAYTNPTYRIVLRRELCCQQKPARALFARIFDRVTNVIRKSFFFFGVRISSVAIKRPLPDGQERRHKKTTTNSGSSAICIYFCGVIALLKQSLLFNSSIWFFLFFSLLDILSCYLCCCLTVNVLSRLSVEGLSRGNWTGFAILMTFLLSLRRLPQFYKKKEVESPMCLITRRRLEVGRRKAVLLDEGVKLCKCCSVLYNLLFSKIIKLSGVSDGVSKCINKNHKTRGALHI